MGGDAAEAGGAHTAAHALGAVEDARAATTAAFATAGLSTASGPASGVLLTAAAAAVVATTGFTAASGASAGVLLVTTAAPAFAPAAGAAALFAATAVAATALTAAGTTVATAFAAGGATVTGSTAALTATTVPAATAFATATAALTAAGPTSGVLLVAATAAAAAVPAAAVSAAALAATAVPAAVTVLAAVVDAAVPEVTGVAAALATEATAVPPEPAEVATGSGTAITEPAQTAIGTAGTEPAITEPARTAIGTADTEPAITEPAQTAIGTADTEPAITEPAEVTQAAVGASLGTPTDMSPEPAEVRPVLVPEPSEVAELTESAAHINRRLLDQPPAEQALGAGGGDVEAAGALVAVSGKGEVGRVVDGGVVTGDVVGRDIRNVMVRQRVCRAPEEQRRLGQPRVECGRSPGGAGLDAEGTEFADLRGCQAESSGHLLGVTVEFGPEGRVDGKAGHGIAKGVVGHVLGLRGSAWVCVRCCLIPAELRIPLVGGNCHFRPSPPMPARTVIRGTA
ncbi:hypothetical protein ACWGKW_16165 [Streptomyces sp. NPDC054766]